MTKRIISGLFILVTLGVLGLILAGALTSGEQLLVRFFTAVIVAGLGLYLISDLRMQADEEAEASRQRQRNSSASKASVAAETSDTEGPPPNSTAAYMATVTGKNCGSRTIDSPTDDPPAVTAPVPAVTASTTIIFDDDDDDDLRLDPNPAEPRETIFELDGPPADDLLAGGSLVGSPPVGSPPVDNQRAMADNSVRVATTPVIDLREIHPPCPPEIEQAISSGVLKTVSQLTAQGRLSAEGPITDRDVRTMVYVAFTASELHKILLAGGTIDGDNSDIDLGRVELLPAPGPASAPAPTAPLVAAR